MKITNPKSVTNLPRESYQLLLQAIFDYERFEQTGSGRFLFTAWQHIRSAQKVSPHDECIDEAFEKIASEYDRITVDLLAFQPVIQHIDLTTLKTALRINGETGSPRSDISRRKSEAAILARQGVAQRALGDLNNGFELPTNIQTIGALDRLMMDASGLGISAVRKIWDEWCNENPHDAKAERDLMKILRDRSGDNVKTVLANSNPVKNKAKKSQKPNSWK